MAIEKYIAAAALALYVIFVMEIITLYHFMQSPPEDLRLIIEPTSFEPYRLVIINETADIIEAGATPMDMNWSIFGSGSSKSLRSSGGDCIK